MGSSVIVGRVVSVANGSKVFVAVAAGSPVPSKPVEVGGTVLSTNKSGVFVGARE